MKTPAVWKRDEELGIAFFCSNCHRFVCANGKCDCGAEIDLGLPKEEYKGKVSWENYSLGLVKGGITMDDLISRSAVFEAIQSSGLLDTISQPEAVLLEKTIKNIKAVYNVDKVVERICNVRDNTPNTDFKNGCNACLVKIHRDVDEECGEVKAGGVNE